MSSKTIYGAVGVAIIGVLFAGVAYNQGWLSGTMDRPDGTGHVVAVDDAIADDDGQPISEQYERVGGVLRAKADVQSKEPLVLPEIGEAAIGKRMGRSLIVEADANPSSRSLAEAFQDPAKHRERLSTLFKPAAFNSVEFERDPETYLATIEPGRIWQSQPKADGVPVIKRLSPLYQNVIQGETVTLRVEVAARSPVTFHSFDLGHFNNSLTTMTVRANDEGVAVVDFTASGGTFGELNILAASPQSSGQANFVVKVALPTVAALSH